MSIFTMQVGIGLLAAAGVAAAARRARALTDGGAVAAAIVGGTVMASAGIRGGAALVTFFASSTLLGKLPGGAGREQRRGNERDAVQVLANGGVGAVLAGASGVTTGRRRACLLAGFGGAVAAAAADTWATEIGSRSRQYPRSIATLRPVSPGTSGGVTLAGLGASLAGAAAVAAVLAAGAHRQAGRPGALPIAVTVGGLGGSLADSVLGATVQHVRVCDACGRETERLVHHCGAPTRHARGLAWCNNDVVNALATTIGAATAALVCWTVARSGVSAVEIRRGRRRRGRRGDPRGTARGPRR